ncbi:hypothetical protein C0J45_12611, partial [Silurus meridionalis]
SREREQELYGPKKRGPKPKTLLLKSRAQAAESSPRVLEFKPIRPQPSSKPQPVPAPAPSYHPSIPSNAKLQSGAAQPKLKKDIHRCHRMARRPLPRPDPLAPPIGSSGPFSSRPPVSPFCETVRILNRKVKPREVKKGRVILNLKVMDKAGTANNKRTQNSSLQSHVGRPKIPSRNRVIGKSRKFGEVSFRCLQQPMSGAGFSVFTVSEAFVEPPRSASSSEVSDGEPHLPHPPQFHPNQLPQSGDSISQISHAAKSTPQLTDSKAKLTQSAMPSSPMFSSSSSSSSLCSSSEDNEHILDLSVPHGTDRRARQRQHFRGRRQPKVPEIPISEEPSEEDQDLDWHPEMAAQCANVVITDVTTNLLTVTIKEFCHPPGLPAVASSPCCTNNLSSKKTQRSVENLERELKRKMQVLEEERKTIRKETQKHQQHIDHGLDAVHQRISSLEQGLSENRFPEGYRLSFPLRSSSMYALVKRAIPTLHALTVCMWLRPAQSILGTAVSYAVSEDPHELVLQQLVNGPVELLIKNEVAQFYLNLTAGSWQHVCASWNRRGGVWHVYVGGKLKGEGKDLATRHYIRPGGTLVLGQEQGSVGGLRFEASRALLGDLSQFNMWDRPLTRAELSALAHCSTGMLGNVVPWTSREVEVFGGVTKQSAEQCSHHTSVQQ